MCQWRYTMNSHALVIWISALKRNTFGRGQQPSLSLQPPEESFPRKHIYFFILPLNLFPWILFHKQCLKSEGNLLSLVMVLVARCAGLCRHLRETTAEDFSSNIDLFINCFFERNVPRGGYHLLLLKLILWPAGNYPSPNIILTQSFLGLCTHCLWELCCRRWGWRQARWTCSMGYSRTGRLRSSPTPQLSRLSRDPHLFCSRLSRLAW